MLSRTMGGKINFRQENKLKLTYTYAARVKQEEPTSKDQKQA